MVVIKTLEVQSVKSVGTYGGCFVVVGAKVVVIGAKQLVNETHFPLRRKKPS